MVQNSAYDVNMKLAEILNINQRIVEIYNYKDIKLFHKDLNYISLEVRQSIKKAK